MGGGKSGSGTKSLVADEVLERLMKRAPIQRIRDQITNDIHYIHVWSQSHPGWFVG
jgi:hypothetical protein